MALQTHRSSVATRLQRALCTLALLMVVGGCGGGGGGGEGPPALRGTTESHTLTSAANGSTYPLRVYLPPASAGSRATLPIIYALDGDWWFTPLVELAEASGTAVIVIGIGNNAARATDYVPPNSCTPGGGGQAAYLAFIRNELIPYAQRTVGGDPARRALLGHSHGGSFVYYALFADAPGTHPFSAYLASDSSVGCMPAVADAWEAAYATAQATAAPRLPVRLHISHTPVNAADMALAQRIRNRRYAQLVLGEQTYNGTHTGIIPAAFADAMRFAFAQ